MAKIEIVRYKCDVCNKEFESEKSIKSESVPCYGEGASHTNARVDMCVECAKKIRKVIYDNFAEIRDYYGLSVKKKFCLATVKNKKNQINNKYLFKAKRKYDSKFYKKGEWVEGAYYIEPYTDKCFIIQWNSAGLGFNEFIEVDGSSVCQCTGLKDKNGKLIWENDIVSDECGNMAEIIWNDAELQYLVDYEFEPMTLGEWCSVVGNIFDNPELLEVGE